MSNSHIFFMSVAVLGGILASNSYEKGKCYCVNEIDDFLKGKMSSEDLAVNGPLYNYTGIKVISDNKFGACVCDDVTRLKTEFVFNGSEAYELSKSFIGQKNTTNSIKNQIDQLNSNPDILAYVEADFLETKGDNSTWYELEVFLKGKYEDVPSFVEDLLNEVSEVLEPDFGTIDSDKINITILKCQDDPPEASDNGTRVVTSYVAGSKAFYGCDENFVLEDPSNAFSVCSHDNLNWTEPETSIECIKGCSGDLAKEPQLVRKERQDIDKKEGSMVKYVCIDGHRSVDDNFPFAVSTCKDSVWTPLPEQFQCVPAKCPKQVPQNPNLGVIKPKVRDLVTVGTRLYYSCRDMACSPYDNPVMVICQPNGNWSDLPDDFDCIPKKDGELCMNRAQYLAMKQSMYSRTSNPLKENYFLIITLPVILALGLTVMCAITIVRVDSPLFRCCDESGKMQGYAYY